MKEQNVDEKMYYLKLITEHIKDHNETVSRGAMEKHIQAHRDAIAELYDCIKKACKIHGHEWISQGRKNVSRGSYDVETEGWDGPMCDTYVRYGYVWFRKCEFCGEEEKKDEIPNIIPTDPFTKKEYNCDDVKYRDKGTLSMRSGSNAINKTIRDTRLR
jgi:hypothetical protein